MATRSFIAIEQPDGGYQSIYVHWDGYPSRMGPLLAERFTNRDDFASFISKGDLSAIGAVTDSSQNVDIPLRDAFKGTCEENRMNKLLDTRPQSHINFNNLLNSATKADCQYLYYMDNNNTFKVHCITLLEDYDD